ncbi:MAG: phosphoadenosine phosphosulfate reductase [Actinomycetota bacterium]|jgi:phosphoadenosine phosphosulfate reductase|nr:phosphoadenosine phosphosulfate reductase [Actinomycetota bacterium]
MSLPEHGFVSPEEDLGVLETGDPRAIMTWASATIPRLAVATSFQSSGLVILHMMRDLRPDVPVLFLDTGFHFAETLEFKEKVTKMWDLNVVDLRGEHGSARGQAEIYGPELYKRDPDKCCFINKVEPLQRALAGYDGWISGLRRDQSPMRAETPIVEAQMLPSGDEVMKIHPLAHWTREDVAGYVEMHSIPTHPLLEKGFRSIGCQPCTRAISDNEEERAGRWDGQTKTECGIHSFGKDNGPRQSEAEQ